MKIERAPNPADTAAPLNRAGLGPTTHGTYLNGHVSTSVDRGDDSVANAHQPPEP